MPVLARIRFLGKDLEPSVVTDALGLPPTRSHRKGDAMPRYPERTRPRGSWGLDSELPETATVEEHVAHLLDRIGASAPAIRRIVEDGAVGELYVSYFVPPGSATVLLHPDVLGRLNSLGLTLLLAIYCEEGSDNDSP